jgi:hypothetical protein
MLRRGAARPEVPNGPRVPAGRRGSIRVIAMAQRFCQQCGAAAEPAALFCATCGARLAAPLGPPDAPAAPATPAQGQEGRPAAPRGPGSPWSPRRVAGILVAATVIAVVALVGGRLALDRMAGPGGSPATSPGPNMSPAPGATDAAVPTTPGPTTPSAAGTLAPSVGPATTAEPAASPPYVAAETPLEAIAAFLQVRGLLFAGLCSEADPLVDVAAYCSELVDERPAVEVHWIGPAGSEPDTWLLVVAGQLGWAVVEWQPVEDQADEPPF